MKKIRTYDSTKRSQAAMDTRERILDTARDLFAQSGVDAVTLATVASDAGVAVSTVYALFTSKTGIVRALMARAIYQGEAREISLLRGASALSPELRAIEAEFESRRYDLQRTRIEALRTAGLLKLGLSVKAARDIMWTMTSRDVFRMLAVDSRWSAKAYEAWLADTLVRALTDG